MGSLSNLYISQSYQSLIHLGTNNTASATLIGLEDGLGNSIGVSVNTAGNLFLSGTFSASLQEGYLYVGNSSGRTIAFPTSSLVTNINTGSLVTTSSFNAYTASTNIRLSNIELTTASVLVSINNINTFTSSANISINALNVFTASQSTASLVTSITNLNQFTQSQESFNSSATASIVALQNFSSSLDTNFVTEAELAAATGSLITQINTKLNTSSFNSYTSSNNQRVSSLESNSASVNTSITNINSFTQSANIRLNNLETTSASVNVSIANINSTTASQATSISNLNLFTQSQAAVNVLLAGEIDALEAKTGSYATTGSNTFIGNQTITGNISAFSASFTYLQTIFESSSIIYSSGSNQFGDELTDIQTLSGSVKVQGSLTINGVPVQTSSFDPSALNQATASLQAFTQSANIRLNNLESTSASVNVSITNINSFTSSQQSFNASATASIVELLNLSSSLSGGFVTEGELAAATGSLITQIDTKLNTSSFNSYTSSNDQRVSSLETNSGSVNTSIANINTFTQSANISINALNSATSSYATSAITASSLITASVSLNTITFTKGDNTTFNITVDTGSGGTTYTNPTLNPYSGSLILAANLTSTASLAPYITASNNGQVNLMFLNRNLTGGVYVSGSSNIFSNPNAPAAGRLNYLGGSSNILLTSFTANNTNSFPTMTGSAATIGGVYPAMNGNILMSQAGWTINPSNNPGPHNYNNNILNGNTIFNMVGNVATTGVANSGLFQFTGNTSAGTFLINSPSRSIAEINAGATGSFRLSITNNNVQGTVTYNGPVSGSATNIHTISANSVAGTLTLNIQSGSKGYGINNNNINGAVTINDNTVFTPTLGSSVSYNNNIINGTATFNTRNSSSFAISNNNINTWTISSDADVSTITSANRLTALNGNILGGVFGNNILYSGSTSTANARKQITSNIMAGNLISASVGGDEQALLATAVLGHGLTVFGTGICNLSNLSVGGERNGSAFFGRWNDNTLPKAGTAETVFAVGTGNSGSAGITRKTGFLIDSGSNTFIEGTLNVSGASTLNGNTIITGSLTLSSSAAIELDVIGNSQFTGSLTVSGSTIVTGSLSLSNVISFAQLDPLPTGADGQLAVSASNLWFYSGSAWNRVAFA